MQFAFGPKVLLDPQFALTFQELKSSFKGSCKIASGASLILREKVSFENLDLGPATLVCEMGTKAPGLPIKFEATTAEDPEVFQIRGYKPRKG